MGKTSKWFRSLFGSKKSPEYPPEKDKKKSKWALSNPPDNKAGDFKDVEESPACPFVHGLDANKHAIAVAAATAAVAEAALAAARAATAVVRLTTGGAYFSSDRRRVAAAVRIQSAFRAYLARRALRALKGLVKLQALVRGHIVRKQSANMLHRMQAMARIQARASAHRTYISEPSNAKNKVSNSRHPGISNRRKYEQRPNSPKHDGSLLKQYSSRSRMGNYVKYETSHISSNWLDRWMVQCASNKRPNPPKTNRVNDERGDKILEIDTWKPHKNIKHNKTRPEYSRIGSLSRAHPKLQKPIPSISSEEVSSPNFPPEGENSSQVGSASSRPSTNLRGPFTPSRSECSKSLFGDYLSHPHYMANTESSRAKVRSQSVPKERMLFEEISSSTNLGRVFWESNANSDVGSNFPAYYMSNIGQLKRQGASTRGDGGGNFSSTYGYRL